MKATGIVRRIDELGRVVIPKEIRRTLHIREGDPMEIFTDRDGEIILKKYSPIGELNDFAKEYAVAIHQSTGHIVAVCDTDVIITVAGAERREFFDKNIHEDVEMIMQSKQKVMRSLANGDKLVSLLSDSDHKSPCTAQVIVPIFAEGNVIGAIMLLSREPGAEMGIMEMKIAETAANFIGLQMDES